MVLVAADEGACKRSGFLVHTERLGQGTDVPRCSMRGEGGGGRAKKRRRRWQCVSTCCVAWLLPRKGALLCPLQAHRSPGIRGLGRRGGTRRRCRMPGRRISERRVHFDRQTPMFMSQAWIPQHGMAEQGVEAGDCALCTPLQPQPDFSTSMRAAPATA